MLVADDAGHADRLEQGIVEFGCAPASGAVWAGGDESAMGFGFAADIEQNATISEFDGDGFIGIDPFLGAGHGDVSRLPGLAMVVTVDGRSDAGTMGIAAGAGGEPDGHDEPACSELNAVIRTGGEHFPVVVLFEGFKGRGDLGGPAPGETVVRAALVKGAHVFEAEEHVHRAVPIRDQHRVVVGDIGGIDIFHRESERVLGLRTRHVGNAFRRAPGFTVIHTATKQDADVIPVADTRRAFPRLAPGEHGAFGGDDDTGDVIKAVGWIFASGEEVLFLNEGSCRE